MSEQQARKERWEHLQDEIQASNGDVEVEYIDICELIPFED